MLHSSRFKASAFPFGISGLKRFSFLPAHLLACVRLKLPVTRLPPTLGYGLVVSLCPTGFSPALCNDLAQPHEPSPVLKGDHIVVLTITTQCATLKIKGDKMAKTETLHIRIEPEIKKKAEKTLRSLGMTTTEAINIYLHQIILNEGLPFEVKIPKPNFKTIQAMEEALVLNEKAKSYEDVSLLMEDLDS